MTLLRLRWFAGPLFATVLLAACTQAPSAQPLDPDLAKMVMPDPGPPTGRPLGELLVHFRAPVSDKAAANALITQLNRRIHRDEPALQLRVLNAVSGGNWRIAMSAATSDLSAERALALVRALPEIQAAEPDRLLQPPSPPPMQGAASAPASK